MIRVSVKWCPYCGELENVHSVLHRDDSETVKVFCPCGKAEPRVTEIAAGERYMLEVEAKREAAQDDDSDPGDVPAGG